jgi:DMSO/TMAO reductase YedYZ molybdopterin-dependent catalytic subunit
MGSTGPISRRGALARLAGGCGTVVLGACDRLSSTPWFQDGLVSLSNLSRWAQRLLAGDRLAPEYAETDVSPAFRANGSTDPADSAYRALVATGFRDWRLVVDGLVERPVSLSLDELRAMPSRTQITRHDCVEGWSCIGKWTGVPLALVLARAGVRPDARYVVFHCADTLDDGPDRYYESIDLVDAAHAQTILAWAMNGAPLPVAHGAPLRLRVERQLGYKMAKYVMRIELVADFAHIGGGRGGYWEDRGYEWYAGI